MSDDKERKALAEARKDVVEYHGNRFDLAVERVLALCESPIERLFAIALVRDIRAGYFWPDMQLFGSRCGDEGEIVDCLRGVDRFACLQQAPIGRYRADFLIASRRSEGNSLCDFDLYVVECDGHDYHERTKEQAARDRSRDREMAMRGYRVVRFTGSEIYRDADRCVEELQAVVAGYPMEPDE